MPGELATAPPAPDLGEFAALPDAAPSPGASSATAYPDLGEFSALPDAPNDTDLGEFADLPDLPKQPGDEAQKALDETPTALPFLPRSGTQFDVDEAKMASSEQAPLISVPKATITQEDPTPEKAAKAAYNTVAGFAEGLTTFQGVSSMLNPFVAVAGIGEMIPELVRKVQEADKTPPNSPERWQAATDVVTLLAAPAIAHGIGKLRGKPVESPGTASATTTTSEPTAQTEALARAGTPTISQTTQGGEANAVQKSGTAGEVPRTGETGQDVEGDTGQVGVGNAEGQIVGAGQTETPEVIAGSQPGEKGGETQPAPAPSNDWTKATEPTTDTSQNLGITAPGTAQLQQAGSAIAGAAGRLKGAATTLKEFHDYRRSRLRWSARNQASTGEIKMAAKEIQKAVPNAVTREGITNWIQASGDVAELGARAKATNNLRLRQGYEAAQRLTPEQIGLANKIRQTYEILRQRAEANGIEIAKLEDYVNQIWKRQPLRDFAASSNRRLSTNIRFAKQRFHESFFHGEQAGLKPETKDIAKLLPIYMNEVNNAISAKQFVAEMAKGKASDGRPLLAPRGGGTVIEPTEGNKGAILNFPERMTKDTSDYKVLSQPALHQWKWVGEENGKPILLKGDLAVHPEVYSHLKNILGTSAIREWYRSPSETAFGDLPKAVTKFLVDDLQQIGKATILGFLSPFHQVQEGTHAIGHRVNPFGGLETIDLRKPHQLDAAQHGLMLLPDRISAQQFREGLDGSTRNLFANVIGKAGKLGAMVKEWSDGYQHYLFEQYIPALKLKTYEHILERNRARFADDLKSGKTIDEQIKLLTAEQTNAAYGHLNYAEMGRNPTLQHIAQMFLLAPDFLEARSRFAGQATAGIFSKTGREQFSALATLAATQWVLARVLNQTLDNDYHWDEPFGVIVGNRRYTMRSVPEDIYKATTDSRRFVSGRLSPLLGRGLLEGLSGVNYRSEPTDLSETITNIIGGMVPLTVQPLTRGLSETGRDNPVSPFEQLLGSLGLHVSRFSPVSRIYPLAKDWVEAHGEEFGLDKKRAVYPISKYQQLRYALEDGDSERAKEESKKLMDSEHVDRFELSKRLKESLNHNFTNGSAKAETAFKNSLDSRDRVLYDAAIERRKLLLKRFHDL